MVSLEMQPVRGHVAKKIVARQFIALKGVMIRIRKEFFDKVAVAAVLGGKSAGVARSQSKVKRTMPRSKKIVVGGAVILVIKGMELVVHFE